MTVNFDIRLREDISGEAGAILENDLVNLGSPFFLEVVGGDFRSDATGLMSTLLEVNYNPDLLQNLDDFNTLPSAILTSKFAAIRTGEINENTGLITLLGGGALPSWGVGDAVGIGELESIALLNFEPLTDASQFTINLNINLSQTNFAGGTDADPDNIDSLEKTFIVNTPPREITLNNLIPLPENLDTTNPLEVATITATDPDENDSLNFSLTGGRDESRFRIEDNRLILRSGVTFDFETASNLELEITANDRASSVSEIVTLPITDVDELPPNIQLSNQQVEENADTSNPFPVGTLSAIDPEGETIFFTVTGGEDADKFLIEENTLFLATGVDLDFSTDSDLNVEITGSDEEGDSLSQSFQIEVTEVNVPPSSLELSNQEIAENTPTPVTLGTIIATDSNVVETLTLSITGGEDAEKFNLVEDELIIAEGVNLDHETQASLEVELTVTDRFGETLTRQFEITVTDRNESPNSLTLSNLEIPENTNTENGVFVGTLDAIDPENDELSFNIIGGNATQFEIRDQELWIAPDVSLNHEQQPELTVEIEVEDEDGLNTSEVFSIAITDVNEPPNQLELAREIVGISQNETLFEPILVGTLSAIDPEGETITFSITGGDDQNVFLLSDNRLFVLLRNPVDRREETTLDVEITASDPEGNRNSNLFSIPTIGLRLSRLEIPETLESSEPIAIISTIDDESGENVTYDIIGGNDEDKVFIEDNRLLLNPDFNLDFETQDSLEVEIRAIDSDGETFTDTFIISVTDVNEPPDAINFETVINEDNPPLTIDVFSLFSDQEEASFNLDYSITNNSNSDLLSPSAIDETTGNLTINLIPNAFGEGRLTLIGEDSGGLRKETTVNIIVNPVNDPPFVVNPLPDLRIEENSDPQIINLLETFADLEDDSDELNYQVEVEGRRDFLLTPNLNNDTGELTLNFFDDRTGIANLTIQAEDTDGAIISDRFRVTVLTTEDFQGNEPGEEITLSPDSNPDIILQQQSVSQREQIRSEEALNQGGLNQENRIFEQPLSFTISNVLETEIVKIEIPIPSGRNANSYFKFDPENRRWFEFVKRENDQVGAIFEDRDDDGKNDVIILNLIDGELGDIDGEINGEIIDPGNAFFIPDGGQITVSDDNILSAIAPWNQEAIIKHQVTTRNSSQTIFEVGFTLLEAEETLPQTPQEKLDAIGKGVSLFSVFPNSFNNGEAGQFEALNLNNLERLVSFSSSSRIAYYLITENSVTSDTANLNNVENIKFEQFEISETENNFTLESEAVTFTAKIQRTETVTLGTKLQAEKGLEAFDFTTISGKVTASLAFDLISVASFDNLIGFYTVDDSDFRKRRKTRTNFFL